MKTPRANRGISLIELMTTISALAITLTFGVPTFNTVRATIQRGQVAGELISSLTLARSEAARRGVPVTVCAAAAAAATCATANPPSWPGGWIVFTDVQGDGDRIVNGTDEIIHRAAFDRPAFSLAPPTGSTIARGVTFRGTGFPDQVGTFSYCDSKATQDLDLNLIGRVEITDTDHGCL